MKRLTWHDNVPRNMANIHGIFTLEDLNWLKHMHPKGRIGPTFSSPMTTLGTSPERIKQAFERYRTEELPFYFEFPIDARGVTLLTALKLKGLGELR